MTDDNKINPNDNSDNSIMSSIFASDFKHDDDEFFSAKDEDNSKNSARNTTINSWRNESFTASNCLGNHK